MTIEFENAGDEIYELFFDAWKSNTPGIVGYVPEIRWQNLEQRAAPDSSKFWARVSKQTVFEEQTALSSNISEIGRRRYTVSGLVIIQIFCPKSNSQADKLGQQVAKIARNAFRGKVTPGKGWFRNARINEIEPEELYYRFNVIIDFEYDEIG